MSTEQGGGLTGAFDKMSVMAKGDEVKLNDLDPGLQKAFIGVGWNAPEEVDGNPVDLDLSGFILRHDGVVRRDTDFIFYNNLELDGGSVKHRGDNKTGDGDGDDEVIEVDLKEVPFEVDRIAFAVTLHNAEERGQNFGLVKDAFIRVVNLDTQVELAHYDLTEDASNDTAIVFGELYRDGEGWNFRAIGQGSPGGLYEIAREYGVNVAPL